MKPRAVVHFSAVDMTLALGAESFLRSQIDRSQVADPSGEKCLADLIDVIVNSNTCFITLPSGTEYAEQPELVERLQHLRALSSLPDCAAVQLKDNVDEEIAKGFWRLMQSLGQDWVAAWWQSQFTNPVVLRHHLPRLGKQATAMHSISDAGWHLWRERVSPIGPLELRPIAPYDGKDLRADIRKAGGLAAYQYCYTFDVVRRGWQYAEATRQLAESRPEIRYCPHMLRNSALEFGSAQWLQEARAEYWSWGRYLQRVIKSSSRPTEVGQVVDWIAGLLDARGPKWLECRARGSKRQAQDLADQVDLTARKAGLPRLYTGKSTKATRLASAGSQLAIGVVLDMLRLGKAELAFKALHRSKVLRRIHYPLGEAGKSFANYFRKGTFGYPGLHGRQLLATGSRRSRRRRRR